MPYKHIASHLKKTELACRLHYHQLSHGSSRRKRTASVSSHSSVSSNHSPIAPSSMPSPVLEYRAKEPYTPPTTYSQPSYSPTSVRLPPASTLLNSARPASASPARTHQPILPKPTGSACDSRPTTSYIPGHTRRTSSQSSTPSLRLDCDVRATPPVMSHSSHVVDHARLRILYAAHRTSFWAAIAAEYGQGATPTLLEEAWKRSVVAGASGAAPPTPCVSPDVQDSWKCGELGGATTASCTSALPATSISALLGIDASPRSPMERELVRRIEEGRSK